MFLFGSSLNLISPVPDYNQLQAQVQESIVCVICNDEMPFTVHVLLAPADCVIN